MIERRLFLEEKIYLAVLKLQDIHWEIAKENEIYKIIKEIEEVQVELQGVKRALVKESIVKEKRELLVK
ncbi:hypothetical protein [Fredinandcohnia sp. 179-A 10B2 NHS]|uniref:hypothetical protein n=1 Tax=Fredinandcohnia sp. 179-A 10B2 NHS TaxID=3235176 RepID=UPI0039A2CFDA